MLINLEQLTIEERQRNKDIKKDWLIITTVAVVITAVLCMVSGTVIGYFAFAPSETTTNNLSDRETPVAKLIYGKICYACTM